jgi:hypothetical protein
MAGTLSTAVLLGTMTFAGPSINHRQINQQKRIRQGVQSGELTRHETMKLEREQGRIARHEVMAKTDGTFTPRERTRIQRELDHSSRDIYRQKHDNQVRQ